MKKTIASLTLFCLVLLAGVELFAQAGAAQKVKEFSQMAATIEKNYGPLLELDVELKGGVPVYSAKTIINNMEVVVFFNAVTGAETGRKPAKHLDYEDAAVYGITPGAPMAINQAQTAPSTATPVQGAGQPAISMEKAREIAIARAGGGTVGKIELDRERGRMVYDMEVFTNNAKYDVYVDANTGEIVKFKQDWD